MHLSKHILTIFVCTLISLSINAKQKEVPFNELSPKKASSFLGWISSDKKDTCGYCKQPLIISKYPLPPSIKKTPVDISADKQSVYINKGISIFKGNVIIKEPGRLIKADKVTVYRNPKTQKITFASLEGNVSLREYNKLIIGNTGFINFTTNIITINNSIYWIKSENKAITGKVKSIKNNTKKHTLTLKDATYSTCSPDMNLWDIWTSTLKIDQKVQTLYATNAVFFAKGIPLFYFPYFQFPIGKERRSGFLFPNYGYSSNSGFKIALPYYLNLAPNYDLTLTPNYLSKRGLFLNEKFRFLTKKSAGYIKGGFIYHDNAFVTFKKNNTKNTSSLFTNELMKSSENRGYISLKDSTHFNSYFSGDIILNYVTDDYFMNDLYNEIHEENTNQLLNKIDLNFASKHWRFLANAQTYQTLHMLNEPGVYNQYARLPELNLTGNYPDIFGTKEIINMEFTNFVYWPHTNSAFISNQNRTTGTRFNIQPSIGMPISKDGIYINPEIQLPITLYNLHNTNPGIPKSITRVIPEISIDSNLLFTRKINFLGKSYTQTLKPRIFYLYVPYKNQNKIPIFDTTLSEFNLDNLFQTNRFDGIDRIGDANQFTLGISTEFIDSKTGFEKMKLGIAQIYALKKHRIFLTNNNTSIYYKDPLLDHKISPIVGELQYNLNANWSLESNLAFNFYKKQVNNGSIYFGYTGHDTVLNLGYNFIKNADTSKNKTINLNRINVSSAINIATNWKIFGQWNYNISTKNSLSYLAWE